MIPEKKVSSIEELITEIRADYQSWKTDAFPWFRGEPGNVDTPLVPKVHRLTEDGRKHNENRLLQHFRMKAPTLGRLETPPRDHTDQWLFLAQHVGLPTRLLDWSEGLFPALHFAVKQSQPVVWMLNPIELNSLSTRDNDDNAFPLTWFSEEKTHFTKEDVLILNKKLKLQGDPKNQSPFSMLEENNVRRNIGSLNVRGAWEVNKVGTELPVAIQPTNIHPRMSAQKSTFTIHGKKEKGISELVDDRVLRKYVISTDAVVVIKSDLRLLGISESSLFPDLDGLAQDLSSIY